MLKEKKVGEGWVQSIGDEAVNEVGNNYDSCHHVFLLEKTLKTTNPCFQFLAFS